MAWRASRPSREARSFDHETARARRPPVADAARARVEPVGQSTFLRKEVEAAVVGDRSGGRGACRRGRVSCAARSRAPRRPSRRGPRPGAEFDDGPVLHQRGPRGDLGRQQQRAGPGALARDLVPCSCQSVSSGSSPTTCTWNACGPIVNCFSSSSSSLSESLSRADMVQSKQLTASAR